MNLPKVLDRSLAQALALGPSLPKKQKSAITKKRDFFDIATEPMKSLNAPLKEDDECDIIGKRFAMQLRGMKKNQMFLSEKISDVMYYGRINKLTEDCFKFNNYNIIQHNGNQYKHNLGHDIQQYSYELGIPTTQHQVHLDLSTSSPLINDYDPETSS